jgi:hypothetical protein
MDETLSARYEILFESYGNDSLGTLAPVKDRLRTMIKDRELRSDAALFIISNFDMMLFRPYFGEIHLTINSDTFRIQTVLPEDAAQYTILSAFDQVINALEGERPYSSHAASLAVERSWDSLSSMFGWG